MRNGGPCSPNAAPSALRGLDDVGAPPGCLDGCMGFVQGSAVLVGDDPAHPSRHSTEYRTIAPACTYRLAASLRPAAEVIGWGVAGH